VNVALFAPQLSVVQLFGVVAVWEVAFSTDGLRIILLDGGTGAVTLRVKEVVGTRLPEVPVTVMVYVPTGVEVAVLKVSTLEQVGLHEFEE
jgi:hypothetical protein